MNKNLGFVERLRWRLKTIEHKIQQYRQTSNEFVIADTEYGKVRGVKRLSLYDTPYFSFEGIPYAQPPIGELRFRAPQRPTPWEGVRDCVQAKDKSVQVHFVYDKVEGSEDCLYLNVYTNHLNPAKPRPVLVWIHGGGFIIGEANRDWYGPDYFIKEDVVLVTIQYRLGAMGFLSLKASGLNVPGNAGLKDQVMALKWIKNNCVNFGGDPDCITVFGESAGAASTHYMMLTEQTQGLFHRGILQSGSAIASWAFNGDITHRAYRIAQLAGYKGDNNDKDVLTFLQTVKARDLIRVEEKVLTPKDHEDKVMFAFGPSLEPFVTPECVIPKHPREMMRNAWSNSIPMMIGNTSNEGLLWLPEITLKPQVVQQLDAATPFIPSELRSVAKGEDLEKWAQLIRKAHVSGERATSNNYMDLCTMAYFIFPALRVLRSRHAHAAGSPVYFYRYDFDSEELIFPYRIMRFGRGVKGVSHADDLTYQFTSLLARRMPTESREFRNIERTVGIWTHFATTGNPYSSDINGMDMITWDPVRKSDKTIKCLNISDDLKYIELPEWSKLKCWESLYNNNSELFF
ncbi:alpha-Est7 [Drosophila busckii]|uniref:Carboxylic ester hydrolase n=1 Tax=Drosophila busckii TaxID=30019 RepID=A0A0M4F1V2_DROBS|nr:esterase B1 [Drosophila busckii]ALC45325.1 alpha-Est7 [Drosophila busckii]